MIDISTFTLGEIATVERLSGAGIATFEKDEAPKGLSMAALAFIVKRRENPRFSWNEAQGITLAEVNEILGFDADDEEEEAAPLDPAPSTADLSALPPTTD